MHQKAHIELLKSLDKDLKILKHYKRSLFISKESIIDEKNIQLMYEDISLINKTIKDNGLSIVCKVKGLIQFSTILSSYQSDFFSEKEYEFIKSKTYFRKYDEQRIANSRREKLIDNFRYTISRVYDLADANFFPFGVANDKDEYILQAYDRGNLTEFCSKNLSRYLDKSFMNLTTDSLVKLSNENVDTITKSELIDLINQIKKYFSKVYPIELDNLLNRIENDAANSNYNIFDIIGSDGIESLHNEVNNFTVVIGHSSVISSELIALNNRNNPWQSINFSYQNILNNTDIAFTTIAKRLLSNSDAYIGIKYHFNPLIDKAPEHILIPFIAYDMFSGNRALSTSQKFADLAFLIEGNDVGINLIADKYKSITAEPDFNFDLVESFYSDEVYDIALKYEKKLKRLKKVIKTLQTKRSTATSDEVRELQSSKIDDLVSQKFGFNLFTIMALIFAKDQKTLKNNSDNVVKAVEYFYETFFGDKIFTVSQTKDEYLIKDPAFRKMLTLSDIGGDSKSHTGRGEYFTLSAKVTEYCDMYKTYVSNIGSNEHRIESEIESMREVTKITELVWWEKLPNGKFECVGYNNNGKLGTTSWEHLKNDTHADGVIRALGCNTAEGAMDKVLTTPAAWYNHIAELQMTKPYIKKHGDEDTALMVKVALKKYAKHLVKNNE